ncbi:BLUF domain-containing protein [Aquimonas voraii]|uniref:Sensors of blue-light using FAD n=1 Tax=Aquimonas voraii TaxID=265719 RepID=A0A1G6ZKH4_9GAMM|nr:BLUF domain-containing protein [Aquimonas voraii]SDE02066.1 Sensors of blue-light using FAD [Aquimonas voraii]
MRRIVYASFSHKPLGLDALFELLVHSRRANTGRGITGALFYQDRFFLQCLEGPTVEVSDLIGRIARDRRHAAFTLLSDQPLVVSRLFSSWAMGFFHMEAVEAIAPPGLLTEVSNFEQALAGEQAADPAAVLLRQYWAANARHLVRPVNTGSRVTSSP